jgi:hypothetical protein
VNFGESEAEEKVARYGGGGVFGTSEREPNVFIDIFRYIAQGHSYVTPNYYSLPIILLHWIMGSQSIPVFTFYSNIRMCSVNTNHITLKQLVVTPRALLTIIILHSMLDSMFSFEFEFWILGLLW